MDTPSVGRIVHYVSVGSPVRPDGTQEYKSVQCIAAIITEVAVPTSEAHAKQTVGLCVFNPSGLFYRPLGLGGCEYSDLVENTAMYPGGTWHWPERV